MYSRSLTTAIQRVSVVWVAHVGLADGERLLRGDLGRSMERSPSSWLSSGDGVLVSWVVR